MKNLLICLLAFSTLLATSCSGSQQNTSSSVDESAEHLDHNTPPAETKGKKPLSPRTNAMANIGETHVHIDYSSPGVRGRTIWGGLVAYDVVWVTGAHQATSISFDNFLKIDGKVIPAGKYAFFTIPGKEEWTLILNENHDQHLADDYDEARDIIRIKVVPEKLEQLVESLTYEVKPTEENKGVISVSWEHLKVSFSVESM